MIDRGDFVEQTNLEIINFFRTIRNKRIVLYGMGSKGRILAQYFADQVVCCIDDDPAKWGKDIGAWHINKPSNLRNMDSEKNIIIVASSFFRGISWRLEEMGFTEGVEFVNGCELFKSLLDEQRQQQDNVKPLTNKKVWFQGNAYADAESSFGGYNLIQEDVRLFNTKVGRFTYIGRKSIIRNANIGQFCSFAADLMIGLDQHPSRGFISTYPSFFVDKPSSYPSFVHEQLFEDISPQITIGNDVWIGFRAVISGGVRIGDGAIIATGAVVTRDVEPYSIVAGVPAKLVRKRYSEEDIATLLKFQWWNKDLQWIETHSKLFSKEELFLEKIRNGEI